MSKKLFWLISVIVIFSMVFSFSLAGCKTTEEETTEEEATEEEAVEEETAEEEVVEEEEAEPKDPVSLIIYSDIFGPVFENLFARFTEDTGYPLEYESLPGDEYDALLSARFLAGEPSDLLVHMGTPSLLSIIRPEENLLDITDWVEKNLAGTLLSEDIIAANKYSTGQVFGVPLTGVTVRAHFYNKNVMEAAGVELPKNYDDFVNNIAPKVADAGYIPLYSMGKDKWGVSFFSDTYVADEMVTTDIQERINTRQATFADTGYGDAWLLQKQLYDNGYLNDDFAEGTYDGAVAAMANDEAFITEFSVVVTSRFTEEENEKLGGLCLSRDGNRVYYGLPNYIYPTAAGKNPEGAMAFMEWFTDPANLSEYYSELKMIVPYIGVDAEMWPVAADYKEYFDAQTPWNPTLVTWERASDHAINVILGVKTVEEALEDMQINFDQKAAAAGVEGF